MSPSFGRIIVCLLDPTHCQSCKITYSRPVRHFYYEPGPKYVLEPRSQVNMGLK